MSNEEQFMTLEGRASYHRFSSRTLLKVGGDDRATFLHNMCTNDVKALSSGQGCEVFFTSVQGKTLLHAFLFCQSDALLISADGGYGESICQQLDRYIIREDVTLSDESHTFCEIWLGGDTASTLLQQLGFHAPTDMYAHERGRIGPIDVTVARVPLAREPTFLIRTLTEQAEQVCEVLANNAAEGSSVMIDALRIDAGFPKFGTDVNDQNLPQEVGRNDVAISFTKGCYLGQETIARIDAVGHVNRQLVRLEFENPQAKPQSGMPVFLPDGETNVGQLTSCATVPQGPIALAWVKQTALESVSDLCCEAGRVRFRGA